MFRRSAPGAPSHRVRRERSPSGRPGLRPHNRLLRPRSFSATTDLLPTAVASDDGAEAGLTTKPHRDRPARVRGGPWLRGPFRLRLASACRPGARLDRGAWTTQPRTRTDSMTETLVRGARQTKGARTGPAVGIRRRVAATAATAATSSPTASRARCASRRRRAGRDARRRRRRPAPGYAARASRRSSSVGQCIEPARLAARSAAPRPAWSTTPGRQRSSGTAIASTPGRRSSARPPAVTRPVGSWPRPRTTPGRDGTGTSTTGPARRLGQRRARPPAASSRAERRRAARAGRAPCARSPARARPRRTPPPPRAAPAGRDRVGPGRAARRPAAPRRRPGRAAGPARAADAAAAEQQVGGRVGELAPGVARHASMPPPTAAAAQAVGGACGSPRSQPT